MGFFMQGEGLAQGATAEQGAAAEAVRLPDVDEVSVDSMGDAFTLVVDKLQEWLVSAVRLLPNFLMALLIVVIFGFLAKLVRKATDKLLRRVTDSPAAARLLSRIAGILVLAVGLFFALGLLQLDKTMTSLLAGAGVVGLALAFAFQDLAGNLIAGFYLSFQKPFALGDLIETNDTLGKVEKVDLRSSTLRVPDGPIVLLPNKEIFENKLVNFTRGGSRRVEVPVGVSYSSNLPEVARVAHQAAESLDIRDESRAVEILFDAFGGSSIDLSVRFWISETGQADFRMARSEAIKAIKKAFDAAGIEIPFPIRTLGFDSESQELLRGTLRSSPEPDTESDSDSNADEGRRESPR